jgi:hypothetical protein
MRLNVSLRTEPGKEYLTLSTPAFKCFAARNISEPELRAFDLVPLFTEDVSPLATSRNRNYGPSTS